MNLQRISPLDFAELELFLNSLFNSSTHYFVTWMKLAFMAFWQKSFYFDQNLDIFPKPNQVVLVNF